MGPDGEVDVFDLQEGSVLPGLTKEVLQGNINLYAQASGDFNPIHIDEEFARQTPLGGTVAHGMLVLAYVSEMMTRAFGRRWLTGGQMNVRFKAPARPGDTLAVNGILKKVELGEDRTVVKCDLLVENQVGETIISGDALITL